MIYRSMLRRLSPRGSWYPVALAPGTANANTRASTATTGMVARNCTGNGREINAWAPVMMRNGFARSFSSGDGTATDEAIDGQIDVNLRNQKAIEDFLDGSGTADVGTYRTGRSWKAAELRLKSYEDLHKLWYVLFKEKNKLHTEQRIAKRMGMSMANPERKKKVKVSMARLKTVLNERSLAHKRKLKRVSLTEQITKEVKLLQHEREVQFLMQKAREELDIDALVEKYDEIRLQAVEQEKNRIRDEKHAIARARQEQRDKAYEATGKEEWEAMDEEERSLFADIPQTPELVRDVEIYRMSRQKRNKVLKEIESSEKAEQDRVREEKELQARLEKESELADLQKFKDDREDYLASKRRKKPSAVDGDVSSVEEEEKEEKEDQKEQENQENQENDASKTN